MTRKELALQMSPAAEPQEVCWVCHRAASDIQTFFANSSKEESELANSIAVVEESREKFLSDCDHWMAHVTEKMMGLDFSFVFANQEQFESLGFLEEAARSRRALVDPLMGLPGRLKEAMSVTLGRVAVQGSDSRQASAMRREIDQFEKATNIDLEAPNTFSHLTLGKGLSILRELGRFYFVVQGRALQIQLDQQKEKRPSFLISTVKVERLSMEVPLCTVCELIVNPESKE